MLNKKHHMIMVGIMLLNLIEIQEVEQAVMNPQNNKNPLRK